MTEDAPVVDLIVEEPRWETALPDLAETAETAARAALHAAGLEPGGHAVALLACGDDRIAALNADFRGKAGPTNVLSWPAFALGAAEAGGVPSPPPGGQRPLHLGDVALALGTAAREAEERGISLKSHATHLILHGCLHLLGYDHERAGDADLMEGIETRALARLGVADPYLILEPGAAAPRPD